MLCETLDQVEDELSGLPNKPEPSMTLDRMFPPQADRISTVEGYDLKRLDSLRHITYIAGNGAMEIRLKRRPKDGSDVAQFSKPGADGRSISDICPKLAAKNL